jgi:hypothetical protein
METDCTVTMRKRATVMDEGSVPGAGGDENGGKEGV